MPPPSDAGPFRTIDAGDLSIPWYMIPFDELGRCTAPLTRQAVLEDANAGNYSDIYLFAHGWNNSWDWAIGRYEHFAAGYMRMRQDHDLPAPANFSCPKGQGLAFDILVAFAGKLDAQRGAVLDLAFAQRGKLDGGIRDQVGKARDLHGVRPFFQ
jgi:hypothetical protein